MAFSTGTNSPGQRRLLNAQVLGFEDAGIGRHLVAGLQQDHVPRHDLLGRQRAPLTDAQHARFEREHVADRLERPFRLALLNEADDRVDQDDAEDDAAFHPLPEQGRDHARHQKDVDQDVVELEQKPRERAAPRRRREAVRAEFDQAARRLAFVQTVRLRAHQTECSRHRERVPGFG